MTLKSLCCVFCDYYYYYTSLLREIRFTLRKMPKQLTPRHFRVYFSIEIKCSATPVHEQVHIKNLVYGALILCLEAMQK